jgi:hypothetical protein
MMGLDETATSQQGQINTLVIQSWFKYKIRAAEQLYQLGL